MNIALSDASSADKIYKFLQFFVNRGDAALGTAAWHAADEGTRRTMIVGIQQQVMHAAGYGATDAGRKELARVSNLADRSPSEVTDAEATQRYAVGGHDIWNDPKLAGDPVHHGVNLSDVQTDWTFESFAQMARNGAQYSLLSRIWGRSFTSRTSRLYDPLLQDHPVDEAVHLDPQHGGGARQRCFARRTRRAR